LVSRHIGPGRSEALGVVVTLSSCAAAAALVAAVAAAGHRQQLLTLAGAYSRSWSWLIGR
jgi:hypothetical protein